jgi:LysR family carnitine catabolism transcriptional activator
MYPNPRHLRAFVALAETGSFGAAAKAVHVGQPALSQAVAKLEQQVGVRLIERTTRSLRLTGAGEDFLVDARRVLDEMDRMMLRGAEWAAVRRGRIHLLAIPSVAHRLLPTLVREFNHRHENVAVEVHDHADPVLRQRLERGEGDLAIVSHTHSAAADSALPFLRDHFRVVMPSHHPFARLDAVEASQLVDQRLILLRRGALFRSYMDAAISRLTLAVPPIEVDQPGTLTGMVEGGLGISLLPALSCPSSSWSSVTSRPLVRPEISRLIAFAMPSGRHAMPAVREFVLCVLNALSESPPLLPQGCEFVSGGAQALGQLFAGAADG